MRKVMIVLTIAATVAAGPVLAQGRSGGGGHGGSGAGAMGGSMGAGPPITAPGRTGNPRGSAIDIASQRGQSGRDFAEQRKMSQAEQAQLFRERAESYRTSSDARRAGALARADLARQGRGSGDTAKAIRNDLKRDMAEWRDAFGIGRSEWQTQRDQWIADRDSLTREEWAERRAAWFAARDQWIATQISRAQTNGSN